MNKMSLRVKIVFVGVLIPTVLIAALFTGYYFQSKQHAIESYVEKSRAIVLAAESAREEMEDKWDLGMFSTEKIREYAENNDMTRLLAAVPVVTAWNSAMRKSAEGGYTFKVPKFDPRNPKNLPDKLEGRALRALKADNLSEYYEIDEKLNAIRYFRPIRLTQTCMACHGDPATSETLWGTTDGTDPTGVRMEGWKVGEIHGAFEIVQSLDEADAALAKTLRFAALAILAGLLVSAGIFGVVITYSVNKPIARIIEALFTGSDEVSSAASQVSKSSQSLAQGATEQAASLEETSSSLEEMSSMTRQNADNSMQVKTLAGEARTAADSGTQAMVDMDEAISKIKKSSDETASIIKVIDEIAFQTNLLALNAAVEAARAGEAGKGFAVVAEEVRNLAMRSAEAAKNTSDMIEESVKNADDGVEIAKKVGASLSEIVEKIGKTTELVSEISAASQEQAQGIEQVNDAVTQMDTVTQQNAASAEESAAASTQLTGQAEKMSAIVASLGDLVGNVGNKTAPAWEAQTRTAARPNSVATAPASAFHQIATGGVSEPDFEMPRPAKGPSQKA